MQSQAGRLVGLGLAAALALTACGGAQPGVAASIDGQRLTVEDVQQHTREFFEDYPEAAGQADPALVGQIAVQSFVRARIVEEVGDEYDLEPTPAELEEIASRDFGGMEGWTQALANQAVPSSREDLIMTELRSYWIQNALRDQLREELKAPDGPSDELDLATREVIDEFAADAEVAVNPRYGTWNGSVIVEGESSLSTPAAELSGGGPAAPGG